MCDLYDIFSRQSDYRLVFILFIVIFIWRVKRKKCRAATFCGMQQVHFLLAVKWVYGKKYRFE